MNDKVDQQPVDENKLIAERRQKLAGIREAEGATFPNDFRRNVMAGELQAEYGDKEKDEIAELNIRVSLKVCITNNLKNGISATSLVAKVFL